MCTMLKLCFKHGYELIGYPLRSIFLSVDGKDDFGISTSYIDVVLPDASVKPVNPYFKMLSHFSTVVSEKFLFVQTSLVVRLEFVKW